MKEIINDEDDSEFLLGTKCTPDSLLTDYCSSSNLLIAIAPSLMKRKRPKNTTRDEVGDRRRSV